jgi:hypothetical protein
MTNWTDDYDDQTMNTMYQQIDDYFTETITSIVLEKYYNSIDNNKENV